MKILKGNGWTVSTKGTENSPMVFMVQDLCEVYPQFSELSDKERINFLKEHKTIPAGELFQHLERIPLSGNGWVAQVSEDELSIKHNTTYQTTTYRNHSWDTLQEAMRVLRKEKLRRFKTCCKLLDDLFGN